MHRRTRVLSLITRYNMIPIATPNFEQDWTLSPLGNWEQFVETTGGSTTLDQTRTHNDAKTITATCSNVS